MGDVERDAFVITMHHSLVHVEAEKDGLTLRDVVSEALTNTLAVSLSEVKTDKVG